MTVKRTDKINDVVISSAVDQTGIQITGVRRGNDGGIRPAAGGGTLEYITGHPRPGAPTHGNLRVAGTGSQADGREREDPKQ